MQPLSRALFLSVPPALTALGFVEHLLTPMANRVWLGWFALSAVACGLLVRSLRPMAVKRRARAGARPATYEEVPASARRAYAAATAAGFLYFLAVFLLPARYASGLVGSLHMGQWLCVCFMPFAASVTGARDMGWPDAVFNLFAALLPVPMLLLTGDSYSARMWVVAVAPVYAIVPGSRRLKILAAAAAAVLVALAVTASRFGIRPLVPFFSWIFAGRSPLTGSLMLSLQHAVYQLAGADGAGAEFIPLVGLVQPSDMAINGVPYLALWLGTRTARIAVGAVVMLLVVSFAEIMILKSPARRAVATGLWFLCAVNAYTGILALFFPEFLSISYGAWGLPFIGSFESALQLLVLLIIIFTGDVVPSRGRDAPVPARAFSQAASDCWRPAPGLPGSLPLQLPEGRPAPEAVLVPGEESSPGSWDSDRAAWGQGPAGPEGGEGSDGAAAPDGTAGAESIEGSEGQAGTAVPEGSEGQAGTAAPEGSEGQAGTAAPEGSEGQVGTVAPEGSEGQAGSEGPEGSEGQAGSESPEGSVGKAGSEGPEGSVGKVGAEGSVG
ncbi:MAG: hypothetical protein LBT40_10840 [Deltaproteobacteria bacterium]|jgi:hypothetical protein|nr:hypothetical protein [Deltaproteobacteria bacterium]